MWHYEDTSLCTLCSNKCDSWWENQTQWHREWKNLFPEEYREISFYDDVLKKNYRADIHTKEGITIEVQNSPLSAAELLNRNNYYGKIIWVVNGSKFKGFSLIKNIPYPNHPLLFQYDVRGKENPLYVRKP